MNKTVFVFLAVCIISTHAFTHVKRETATTPAESDPFKDLKDMFQKQFQAVGEALKPENIKKGVSDGIATVQKGIDDFKKKFEEPKKA